VLLSDPGPERLHVTFVLDEEPVVTEAVIDNDPPALIDCPALGDKTTDVGMPDGVPPPLPPHPAQIPMLPMIKRTDSLRTYASRIREMPIGFLRV
jgi:hypothetical protein